MPDIQPPCPPAGICSRPELKESPHVKFSRDRHIGVEERGKRYILHNPARECIARLKVDDGLPCATSGKKADYLLVRCEQGIAYFVELKGCDVARACEQILATIESFHNVLADARAINARIVCSRASTPDLRSSHRRRLESLCKNRNGTLIISTKEYRESCGRAD